MEKYILLAEICFDWSRGEYSKAWVDNIYLGCGEFDSKEHAEKRALFLMKEYCIEKKFDNNPLDYESTISVKKI